MAKTKEKLIDFRKDPSTLSSTIIDGQAVDVMERYKYLSIISDDKLTFDPQVDAVCKNLISTCSFIGNYIIFKSTRLL